MKLRHPIQLEILQYLLFHPKSRFSEVKPQEMDNSKFTFHMDQLIDQGLVNKTPDGTYRLSPYGKDEANRFDPDADLPRIQSKVSAIFCCKNTQTGKWLQYTRKKEPYFDHQGFPTGKVQLGENFTQTAERELQEETGLVGKATLLTIIHVIVKDKKTDDLLEDKVMGVCLIEDPEGSTASHKEGAFFWTDTLLPTNQLPLPETEIITKILSREETFIEHTLYTEHY